MPIYEYRCRNCSHQIERIQKMNDAPLEQCPECHQNTLRKLISATSFKLTGTGWYETDFKNQNKPVKEPKKDTESETKKTEKTETTEKKGKTEKTEKKEKKEKTE